MLTDAVLVALIVAAGPLLLGLVNLLQTRKLHEENNGHLREIMTHIQRAARLRRRRHRARRKTRVTDR